MTRNTSIILVIALILLLASIFFSYQKRVENLRRQVSIESAKTDFLLRQFDNQNQPFDSVKVNADTVLFYKDNIYKGKSIIIDK